MQSQIAIVGMSARFAGARNLHQYWRNIIATERQFTKVPQSRWNHTGFYDPDNPRSLHKAYTNKGAFLEDIEMFAGRHYGLPPARVHAMDPQHRLLLDAARSAWIDAGFERRSIDRSAVGVFVGMSSADYRQITTLRLHAQLLSDNSLHQQAAPADLAQAVADRASTVRPFHAFSMPGCLQNMGPALVSSVLNLGGPSFAVDAACSSSLVALHQGIAALRSGQCSTALVGGVYLSLVPDAMVAFSRIGALSRTGVCRPFDGAADGFVLGEGVGMVIIKPLQQARADGDDIYAVIRGSGMSNDGQAEGPMTPTVQGQMAAMQRAYADAVAEPTDLEIVEAHGTATTVGDRTEIACLAAIRGESAPRRDVFLTSIKALIGHTMAAAGIASLIKAALVARYRIVPGQPEMIVVAHDDALTSGRLVVPSQPVELSAHSNGLLGVSSFGFGGTNVHAVLEQPPTSHLRVNRGEARKPSDPQRTDIDVDRPRLLIFSAQTLTLLIEHLQEIRAELGATTGDVAPTLAGIARTLNSRAFAEIRLAVVCESVSALSSALDAAIEKVTMGHSGALAPNMYIGTVWEEGRRQIAYVFPGQGSQVPHMQADLYARFQAFRDAADALNSSVLEQVGLDPLAVVYADDAATDRGIERLTSTEVCQPALTVMGLALVDLLRSFGIKPDIVLGHSVGELAAAAAVAALAASDAVQLAAIRGAHMNRAAATVPGGMLAVGCDPDAVMSLLDGIDGAWPAAFNDPHQSVVSGTTDALQVLSQRCDQAAIPTRLLRVATGFHSPLLEPIRMELIADLAQFHPQTPIVPLISTVTGAAVRSGKELGEHLVSSVFTPVRFSAAVNAAYASGARIFIQVGGGDALLNSLRRCLAEEPDAHIVASSGSAPDSAQSLLQLLGQLVVLGVDVDLDSVGVADAHMETAPGVPLPIAPIPTQCYWVIGKSDMHTHATKAEHIATPPNRQCRKPHESDLDMPLSDLPTSPSTTLHQSEQSSSPGAQAGTGENEQLAHLITFMNRQLSLIESARAAIASDRAATARVMNAPEPPKHSVAVTPSIVEARQQRSEVEAGILAIIAKISGYPIELIHADMHLTESLGFDSLMVRELITGIGDEWPALPAPAELGERFALAPTIGDIVAYVSEVLYPGVNPLGDTEAVGAGAVVTVASINPKQPPSWSVEDSRIEAFPEALALRQRRAETERNPYFLQHQGVIGATTQIADRQLVSFSSYNYLGLSGHPLVTQSVTEAVARYGSSVSASRFLSGERPIHAALESEIAALLQVESALVFVSGHATNVSVIGHIVGPGDLIVHDELAHDSIIQGAKLSGAIRRSFPHNDVVALEELLGSIRAGFRRVLLIVEGIYSMDGDLAALPELIEVKKRYGALLLVDEAHSIGTVGTRGGGIGEYFGVDRPQVDLWVGTMSKSLAGCGGYVGGSTETIDYLKYSVPGFVYSVGITPANTAASLAALWIMRDEPERLDRLRRNGDLFRELAREGGINIGASQDSPVIPCIVGNSQQALDLSTSLFDAGYSVNPILYPAVPENQARLRFFVTADHTQDQIGNVVALVAGEVQQMNQLIGVTE